MSEPSITAGRFFNDNGLSLALFALFITCLASQAATGFVAYNSAQDAAHLAPVGLLAYIITGNFLDGVFSNWQAAVLQLAVLISFGAVLRQKGPPTRANRAMIPIPAAAIMDGSMRTRSRSPLPQCSLSPSPRT